MMIDLFLPFFLGVVLGIDPADGGGAPVAAMETAVPPLPVEEGSGDGLSADRDPEPQIATGKFTTALEVRPILGMTKTNWVGVREFNGQDLVYFTGLLTWRCGLWDIRYGINGAPATTVVAMEPCNEDYASPNALIDIENFPPYTVHPLGSVDSIAVEIVFDDGGTDSAAFQRNEVLIP